MHLLFQNAGAGALQELTSPLWVGFGELEGGCGEGSGKALEGSGKSCTKSLETSEKALGSLRKASGSSGRAFESCREPWPRISLSALGLSPGGVRGGREGG